MSDRDSPAPQSSSSLPSLVSRPPRAFAFSEAVAELRRHVARSVEHTGVEVPAVAPAGWHPDAGASAKLAHRMLFHGLRAQDGSHHLVGRVDLELRHQDRCADLVPLVRKVAQGEVSWRGVDFALLKPVRSGGNYCQTVSHLSFIECANLSAHCFRLDKLVRLQSLRLVAVDFYGSGAEVTPVKSVAPPADLASALAAEPEAELTVVDIQDVSDSGEDEESDCEVSGNSDGSCDASGSDGPGWFSAADTRGSLKHLTSLVVRDSAHVGSSWLLSLLGHAPRVRFLVLEGLSDIPSKSLLPAEPVVRFGFVSEAQYINVLHSRAASSLVMSYLDTRFLPDDVFPKLKVLAIDLHLSQLETVLQLQSLCLLVVVAKSGADLSSYRELVARLPADRPLCVLVLPEGGVIRSPAQLCEPGAVEDADAALHRGLDSGRVRDASLAARAGRRGCSGAGLLVSLCARSEARTAEPADGAARKEGQASQAGEGEASQAGEGQASQAGEGQASQAGEGQASQAGEGQASQAIRVRAGLGRLHDRSARRGVPGGQEANQAAQHLVELREQHLLQRLVVQLRAQRLVQLRAGRLRAGRLRASVGREGRGFQEASDEKGARRQDCHQT